MKKRWVPAVVALLVSIYLVMDSDPVCDTASMRGARVLVTGASTGIGAEMSRQFARLGARLALTARKADKLAAVSEECLSLGATSSVVLPGSMEDLEFAREVVRNAVKEMGGLDYLVLNHVGLSPMRWWRGDARDTEALERSTRLNFLSFVSAASEALAELEASGGAVLVISSICGKVPMPLVSPYASSKFALEGFFGSLRRELILRQSPVSISIANLGYIDTDTAVSQVRDQMGGVTPAPVGPCAAALVEAVCSRAESPAHPALARGTLVLQRWAPAFLWSQVRASYNLSAIPPPPAFKAGGR